MRIVVDAMGSDTCPEPEVQAAMQMAGQSDVEIILVGPQTELENRLQALGWRGGQGMRVVDAPESLRWKTRA